MSRMYGKSVLEEFGSADITFQPDHVDPLNPAPEAEIGLNDDAVFQGDQGKEMKPSDFFEDPQPNEVPVLKEDLVMVAVEDLQHMAELERKAKNLNHILNRIETEGGMSKSIALEARQMFPEFDNGVNIAYYTEFPSMTRKQIATEQMKYGMWGVIIAAAAAIAAAIYKLYKWLTGKDDATAKDASDAARHRTMSVTNAVHALKTVEKTTEEIDREVKSAHLKVTTKDVPKTEEADLVTYTDFDTLLDIRTQREQGWEYARDFLDGKNPFMNDVVSGGPYFRMYLEVGSLLDVMIDNLESRMKAASHVVETTVKDRRIATEFTLKRLLKEMGNEPTYNVGGKPRTVRELNAALAEARSKAHDAPRRKQVYSAALRTFIAHMSDSKLTQAMMNQVKVYERLDFIRKQADEFAIFLSDYEDQRTAGSTDPYVDPRYNLGTDTGPMMIKFVLGIRSELAGFEMLLQSVHQVELQIEHTYRVFFSISRRMSAALASSFRRDGQQVPDTLLNRIKLFNKMNAEFGQLFKLRDPEKWKDSRYRSEDDLHRVEYFERELNKL